MTKYKFFVHKKHIEVENNMCDGKYKTLAVNILWNV